MRVSLKKKEAYTLKGITLANMLMTTTAAAWQQALSANASEDVNICRHERLLALLLRPVNRVALCQRSWPVLFRCKLSLKDYPSSVSKWKQAPRPAGRGGRPNRS